MADKAGPPHTAAHAWSLRTTDHDEAQTFFDQGYSVAVYPAGAGEGFSTHITGDSLGPVQITHSRYAMGFTLRAVQPVEATSITSLRRGELAFGVGGDDNRWSAGDLFVAATAGSTWEAVVRDSESDTVVIDPATFAAVAQTANGAPVALTGHRPVSPEAARLWEVTSTYARQVVRQRGLTALVAGETARLLAATALAVFPTNAVLDPTIADRHDAHPLTLRRAVSFMESNADRDLTVVDIAAAAAVTPRALQLVFRRHLDTTPMGHLRRIRLDAAHRDLLAADPDVYTVGAVAMRWGFASPSRFAAQYRQVFGRAPSVTLHQRA